MTRLIWIKQPLAIHTNTDADGAGGLVVDIDQGVIREVLGRGEMPGLPCEEVFDARQHVVLPGLINTHHHFYQTLTRALPAALNKPLFPWLKTLYPIWARLDESMLSTATELALSELLLSGCTTAADHHYVFPDQLRHGIDIQVDAAEKTGMRVTLTRGSMSLGADDGGLPPQSVVQKETQILEDSLRLIKRFHDPAAGSKRQIALAPCSPFSVTSELMSESALLAEQYGIRLHTHLAETLDEEAFCLKRFGMRTVDYLEHVGWLSRHTWLAHGIHFNQEEIRRLGEAETGVCHCPSSNMVLASGICPVKDLEDAGSPVGLGVDGSASNDCSNLMAEVRQAMYLQRLKYGAEAVSHTDALGWATQGSARLLGRPDLGILDVGMQADLALFRLDELRFSGSHDPLAALVLCGAHRADRVMVAGRWLVEDATLVNRDEARLRSEHQQQAERLVSLL